MTPHLKQHLTIPVALFMTLALTLIILTPIATAAPEPSDVPAFVGAWGAEGSGNGEFWNPNAIATDLDNNIYVADTNNHRIQKFDSDGNYLAQWGAEGSGNGQFYGPRGVAVDSSNNIYVADFGNNRIQKFDSDGNYIAQWASSFIADIATDNNSVYVVNSNPDISLARIQKFDTDGNLLTQWGSFGFGVGQFDGPKAIAVDLTGNVYVGDNNYVQKFDGDGTLLAYWSGSGINALAGDVSGNLYTVPDLGGNGIIIKSDSLGSYLGQWGGNGDVGGLFDLPNDVSVDRLGNVYVADTNNHRIQKFSYPSETASLVSSVSGADIELSAAAFTTFSCSTSVTEDSLATTDPNQDYPLGLVDFCLDVVPGSTNTVSLTFETDLSASEVTARKYNPTTQTYTDIPDAEITETTLDGSPALQLTYDITDGGDLDDDGLANGTILDPVGLAVDAIEIAADTDGAETLAETGQNLAPISLIAIALMLLSLISFKKGRQTL